MQSFVVGVFLPGSKQDDKPFDTADYRQSYYELSQAIAALGGTMVLVRDVATYRGQGYFTHGWVMRSPDDLEWQASVQVDVLFDRGEFPFDPGIPFFNHPEISHICTDKYAMYEQFRQFCPLTLRADTRETYQSALAQIKTERVVVKPLAGQEGQGVLIDTKAVLSQAQDLQFPVVVQEFLDTSGGVLGIVEGYHDLRVALYDGAIIYAYVRTPPPGKLTANVAQGGKFFMIEQQLLPVALAPLINAVDRQVAYVGPRFYGIDFAMTPEGPKIIEMNARLGLLPNQDSPAFVLLKQKLAQTLATLAHAD